MPKSRRHNRRRAQAKKVKTRVALKTVLFSVVAFLMIIVVLFLWKLSTVEKFSYVLQTSDGGADVVVVDPQSEIITSIQISPETQIDLSNNLGYYKLGSAWKLAEDEGLTGELIARSIVKNFSIPVYFWKDENGTNLDLFKKLKVWFLDKKLINYSYSAVDLNDTPAISKKRLKDGSEGYLVVGEIPSYVLVNFVDQLDSTDPLKVEIVDASGSYSLSDKVSKVFSTMGSKVGSYSREDIADFRCRVSGKESGVVEKIAKIFDCEKENNFSGESDIRFEMGKVLGENY